MRNNLFKKVIVTAVTIVTTVSMSFSGIDFGASKVVEAATSVSGVSTISNMPSGFARGVDISEVIALEKAGASYKYLDGTSGDIFDILKGAGVNYVRIRIWNNPYDSSSPYKGYGAGNCDLYNAKVLGKRATDAGMKVFIDFHYSDFWADPAKQFAPLAWKDYSLQYKKDAVYNFTYESLCELLDYGVNIGMVQIGNETNGSMCGVGGLYDGTWDLSSGVADLMKQGCYAVDDVNDEYGKSMLKVLHFTDLLTNGEWYAQQVNKQGIDYDVFATSFYPMWHGATSDMTTVLKRIVSTYNKKVLVAETAYPYTFTDNDGNGNMVGDSSAMSYSNYTVSVSGQAQALYDVFAGVVAVNSTKSGYGLGVFYWAPEWIPTSSSAWGTYGTGWASSTSGNYEKAVSGSVNFYSSSDKGCSWDNMTLFDKNGQAMKSLYVFNDICGYASTTSGGSSESTQSTTQNTTTQSTTTQSTTTTQNSTTQNKTTQNTTTDKDDVSNNTTTSSISGGNDITDETTSLDNGVLDEGITSETNEGETGTDETNKDESTENSSEPEGTDGENTDESAKEDETVNDSSNNNTQNSTTIAEGKDDGDFPVGVLAAVIAVVLVAAGAGAFVIIKVNKKYKG